MHGDGVDLADVFERAIQKNMIKLINPKNIYYYI